MRNEALGDRVGRIGIVGRDIMALYVFVLFFFFLLLLLILFGWEKDLGLVSFVDICLAPSESVTLMSE